LKQHPLHADEFDDVDVIAVEQRHTPTVGLKSKVVTFQIIRARVRRALASRLGGAAMSQA
jgi:hypothetical protein